MARSLSVLFFGLTVPALSPLSTTGRAASVRLPSLAAASVSPTSQPLDKPRGAPWSAWTGSFLCPVLSCPIALWDAVVRCCVVRCCVVWCDVLFRVGSCPIPEWCCVLPIFFSFCEPLLPSRFPLLALKPRCRSRVRLSSRRRALTRRWVCSRTVLCCAVLCPDFCVVRRFLCFGGVASSAVVRWARRVSARAVVLSAVLRCNPNPPPSVLAAWCWVALCRVLLDSNPLCCLPTGSVRPSVRPSFDR